MHEAETSPHPWIYHLAFMLVRKLMVSWSDFHESPRESGPQGANTPPIAKQMLSNVPFTKGVRLGWVVHVTIDELLDFAWFG